MFSSFKIEPGKGKLAGYFRLVDDVAWRGALVSKGDSTLTWHKYDQVYDDQYFRFLLDDLVVERIVYDATKRVERNRNIEVFDKRDVTNINLKAAPTSGFKLGKTITTTQTLEWLVGFALRGGTEIDRKFHALTFSIFPN